MIGDWTLADAAAVMGGVLSGSNASFERVSTDTRHPDGRALFFALEGARYDAHDFLAELAPGEFAGVVVQRSVTCALPVIRVDDTVRALGQLGQQVRRRFKGPVVAITGSNGKTTVKEMVAGVLAAKFGGPSTVCRTEGNLNNHLGVPLSLLKLVAMHQCGVFELGASHSGEIAYTTSLCEPDCAVITNIGEAHLGGFGDRPGIAQAKSEIFAGLPATGTAIIGIDSDFFDIQKAAAGQRRKILFGLDRRADLYATDIEKRRGGSQFTLHAPDGVASLFLPVPGRHNVLNALAAASAAHVLGLAVVDIAQGLAGFETVTGRLQFFELSNAHTLIDDTYNASPASMKAALDVLSSGAGKRVAVLGDMSELGDTVAQCHADVGRYAAARCDQLIVMGSQADAYRRGYGSEVQELSDLGEIVAELRKNDSSTILVKGSRSSRMERVVNALRNAQWGRGA